MGNLVSQFKFQFASHQISPISDFSKHQNVLTKHHTRVPTSPSSPDYDDLFKYISLAATVNNDAEWPVARNGLTMPNIVHIAAADSYRFDPKYLSLTTKQVFIKLLQMFQPLGFGINDIVYISVPESNSQTTAPFYIILKDGDKHIVITRGTNTIGDFLTDDDYKMVGIKHKDEVFKFHNGFYKCAQVIVTQLDSLGIRDATFIGISMGAAISSVASIICNVNGQHTTAWAFAQPPCASANAAEYAKGFIKSYHVENDNVARLSIASVRNFCWRIQQLNEGKDVANMATAEIQQKLQDEDDAFCAGHVYVMYAEQFYEIAKEELAEMVIAPVQILDHYLSYGLILHCDRHRKMKME